MFVCVTASAAGGGGCGACQAGDNAGVERNHWGLYFV